MEILYIYHDLICLFRNLFFIINRIIHSIDFEITNVNANPLNPKYSSNNKIPINNETIDDIDPNTTISLFSFPNNSEVKIIVNAVGITAKLII